MSAPTFTIGGVNLSAQVAVDFEIQQVVSRRGDTAHLLIYDVGNTLTVADFATVSVTDDQGNLLFKGWATKVGLTVPSVNERVWDLQCQDATIFLQARAARKTYSNWFVTDIARDLVLNQTQPTGITANNTAVGQGAQISFTANNGYISDELKRLAKLASATSTLWDWYVDYNQDLHFYGASAAPLLALTFTDAEPPLAANTWWYERESFSYERDNTQLATKVIVAGSTYLSPSYTQSWVGDGVTTSFSLDFPPDTQNGGMPTITVAGVTQTIATDSGQTPSTQWLLSQATDGSWVVRVGTAGAPASGTTVAATYKYDVPVLVQNANYALIAANANLPNQGYFDKVVVDSSLQSQSAGNARAAAEIAVYGYPYRDGHLEVQDVTSGANGIGTLAAGAKVTVINAQVPDLVSPGLQLLIQKLTIKGTHGQSYRYSMDLQG